MTRVKVTLSVPARQLWTGTTAPHLWKATSPTTVQTRTFSEKSREYQSVIDWLKSEKRKAPYLPYGKTWTTQSPTLRAIVQGEELNGTEHKLGRFGAGDLPVDTHTPIIFDYLTDKRLTAFKKRTADTPSPFVVAVGGPSARMLATFFARMHYDQKIQEIDTPPLAVCYEYGTGANSASGKQIHTNHMLPMYYTARHSAPAVLERSVWRALTDRTRWHDSPLRDDYTITETLLTSLFHPDVLQTGAKYFWYGFNAALGYKRPALQAVAIGELSKKFMKTLYEDVGVNLFEETGILRVEPNTSATKGAENDEKLFRQLGFAFYRISPDKAEQKFGVNPTLSEGGSIWHVPSDGILVPESGRKLLKVIEEKYKGWTSSKRIERVFINGETGTVCGVENITGELTPTNCVYLSPGAFAKYAVATSPDTIRLTNLGAAPTIPVTGASFDALITGKIETPVDGNNTHITPFQKPFQLKNDYEDGLHGVFQKGSWVTPVRITGGGYGSAPNNPTGAKIDHALNVLYMVEHVLLPGQKCFPLTFRSCARPVTAENLPHILKVSNEHGMPTGLFINASNGGVGVTASAALAGATVQEILRQKNIVVDQSLSRVAIPGILQSDGDGIVRNHIVSSDVWRSESVTGRWVKTILGKNIPKHFSTHKEITVTPSSLDQPRQKVTPADPRGGFSR